MIITWLRVALILGLRAAWPCLELPKTHTWSGARSVSKIGCPGDCWPSVQWHKGGENLLAESSYDCTTAGRDVSASLHLAPLAQFSS
jgi:hypothetical protein